MKDKCPYCGKEVLFINKKFICELCGASALSDHETGNQIGLLADYELLKCHKNLKPIILKLWKERLINKVAGYMVTYKYRNKTCYGYLINKDSVIVKDVFTGKVVEVNKTETIPMITKVLAWVSAVVGRKEPVTDYKWLNAAECYKAMSVINERVFAI